MDLSRVDLVEDGHHDERVEDHREVDRRRCVDGGPLAVVNVQQNIAYRNCFILSIIPFQYQFVLDVAGTRQLKTYSKSSAHQISGITFVRPSYLICSSLICVSVFFLSTLISSMHRMNIFLWTTRFSKSTTVSK